ncbi:restriction endonuclease [Candidatus Nitrosacidococcus sp. I8]|uniref:restriction endonuclease n=1 Tax=Candidatus Nitrosacidococcus sp. I8 TaxID=2942908 RepID=UPI0022260EE8|nr:restriction endonuclease [Candidatus Nitrosacidococcus sp. I8]CAH9019355.1 Mrr restriction system protein [Candidatus Nitrosacidococcus sp. I8]
MDVYFKYKYDELFNPTLQALKNLGNSGSVSEIEAEIIKILQLSNNEVDEILRGSTTKLACRLSWARYYLKDYGLLENSSQDIWSLTDKGHKVTQVDPEEVKRFIKQNNQQIVKEKAQISEESNSSSNNQIDEVNELTWQDQLLETIKKITPDQFEKLCQRLLRELGFKNVVVTGKSNDGGIDGKGILRIGHVLSFHIVFQAKRYQGTVSSSVVRDFRGSMEGRAEKGLIMTTGVFSLEAQKEAERPGAKQIDLIDGNEFIERLKELGLGVEIEMVEKVSIKQDWFKNL